jgi:hypothetical protein
MYELDLLYLAALLVITFQGPGPLAIDYNEARKQTKKVSARGQAFQIPKPDGKQASKSGLSNRDL